MDDVRGHGKRFRHTLHDEGGVLRRFLDDGAGAAVQGLFAQEAADAVFQQHRLALLEDFEALGKAFNVDLSGYAKDLSTSMSASVSYEKQTQIFDDMKEKHQDIYNSK